MVPVLLSSAFVVEGVLGANDYEGREGLPVLPVTVTQVLLGTTPSGNLQINTIAHSRWPAHALDAGARVLAWGLYWPDGSCSGRVAVVDKQGGLTTGMFTASEPGRPLLVDGRAPSEPGTYSRVVASLRARVNESPAGWLASGTGVALVEVDSSRGRVCNVHLVRTVAGEASPGPRVVIVDPVDGYVVRVRPRAQFLVPTFAAHDDTLRAPVQVKDRVTIQAGWIPALGIHLQDLGSALRFDSTGGHVVSTRPSLGSDR